MVRGTLYASPRDIFPPTRGQLWWSRHDWDFRELLDTRGRNDVESPVGDWTKVECVCDGSRLSVRVNGAVAWGLASEPGTAMWDAFANGVHSRFDMIAVEFVQGIREHIVYLGTGEDIQHLRIRRRPSV